MEEKENRKANLKEIKIWYKFKPSLDIWFSKDSGKTYNHKLPEESWYDGFWFNAGHFFFIQCKLFAIHVKFTWWSLDLDKGLKIKKKRNEKIRRKTSE